MEASARTLSTSEIEAIADPLPEEFEPSSVRRHALILAAIGAAIVAVIALVPGLGDLRDSFAEAKPGWLVVAGLLQLGSCLSYVAAFRAVFCTRMPYRTSFEIGMSELAANALLSVGGAGGLALGVWILRRGGMDTGHIARRTVAFFLITSLANVTFLVLAGAGLATGALSGSESLALALIPAAAGVAAILLALGIRSGAGALAARLRKPKLSKGLAALSDGIGEAVELLRSRDPALLIGATGYMLFDVAMLGACFAAFGFPVPAAGILLVAYLVGQLGNLIPIPGGIGGVDAGLIGTLVLYGVEPVEAISAVIAYRAFVLWIPAAIGLPALASLRRRLANENHDIAACTPGQRVEVLGAGIVQAGASPVRLAAANGAAAGAGCAGGDGNADAVCAHLDTITILDAPADAPGCEECLADGDTWNNLRMCQACGHVGCCDDSPNRHATAHHHATGHPVIRSIEPGEEWSWCYVDEVAFELERAG
ncbi:MAG TPA: lysylphosphatidylglycerol synthase domain-containing protein [Solirubrobacterales bacterium]